MVWILRALVKSYYPIQSIQNLEHGYYLEKLTL